MTAWNLVDAEVRAAEHPKTFQIPTRRRRHGLQVGALAKLMFDDRERMWVEVVCRKPAGWYGGALRNNPLGLPGKWGDLVVFHARHVIDVESSEGMEQRRQQLRSARRNPK